MHISSLQHGRLPCFCIVRDACGSNLPLHMHSISLVQAYSYAALLRGTACDVMDDGSTRSRLVATDRPIISTALLQKLKGARRSRGTAATKSF